MAAHHQHHHHHHDHSDDADFDPGVMYKEAWVQDLVRKIQEYVKSNSSWLGLREEKNKQRVLDYACGHGTISLALVETFPNATFQGIDVHPAQVQRFNEEARRLTFSSTGASQGSMYAVVGDLFDPSLELDKDEWYEFDVAIMSMALHHVADPVDMLVRLRKRLREGGTLILVEWFNGGPDAAPAQGGSEGDISESSGPNSQVTMVETAGGQHVWPGFAAKTLEDHVVAAGFRADSVDVRVPGITFHVPEDLVGAVKTGENALVFVKAVAPYSSQRL